MTTTGMFDLVAALDRRGLLPRGTLEHALEEANQFGTTLHQVLVSRGLISEQELDFCLSEELGIPQVHLTPGMVDAELVRGFPGEVLRRRRMVPVIIADGEVTVALSDPLDQDAIRDLERVSPYRVRPAVANSDQILQVLDAILGPDDTGSSIWAERTHQILVDAFTAGAAEIHIEPVRAGTRIRQRQGGILEECEIYPPEALDPFLERFRELARLPSGGAGRGRLRVNLGGVGVDIDLSILPTPLGGAAVLSFVRAWRFPAHLEDWPFEPRVREVIQQALAKPGGLVIVNSPREARRRALSYALLGTMDPDRQKVLTLERAAFRRVPEWTQVEEDELPAPDERQALELLLDQRPDALLLQWPADWALEMALPAVLEGMRLVLDMPYVDASDVLLHLKHMRMPVPLLDRTLRLILSVGAVPGLCTSCRIPIEEDEEGDPGFEAPGCEDCDGTGQREDVLVPGLFVPSGGSVRELLRAADGSSLLTTLGRQGHATIRRNARRFVRTGAISSDLARELL